MDMAKTLDLMFLLWLLILFCRSFTKIRRDTIFKSLYTVAISFFFVTIK